MDLKETYNALREFGKVVRHQARTKLSKSDKNVSKDLWNSIESNISVGKNSISMDFLMNSYGMFQNFGVRGTESGKSLRNYSYKQSSNLVGLEYHTGALAKWAKYRKMQPRDKKGRFGSYRTMGFILANSIKKKGIKPSLFFTEPFEKAFNDLPKELVEAFDLDLDNYLDFTLKDNLKK
jgi:hypothetical protein